MKKIVFTILSVLALVLLATSLVDAYSYRDGYLTPYEEAYPSTYYTDKYYRPSFSTHTIQPYFQQRNTHTFQDRFQDDLVFDTEEEFDRDYRDVFRADTQNSLANTQQFSNNAFGSFNEGGDINKQDSYSASKGPCQTHTIHYNPSGKDRDVRYTETFCDNIQYKQSGDSNYRYTLNNNAGFNNNAFGKAIQNQKYTDSTSFSDILNNRYKSKDRYTSNSLFNNQFSDRYAGSFFSWLF